MAKRWHPDLAPASRQYEHERHLKAINEVADQLEQLAENSRGGKVSKSAVNANQQAYRRARAEEGRRAYERDQAEQQESRRKHDPFASRAPDHSVVHRYARCVSYPEWGVGTVDGVYFSGEGESLKQWARVKFQIGVRTVPAGSLQFVDFSKPDPGGERVERFVAAAKHAMADGDFVLAAKRLVYARDAEPTNTVVLRLMVNAYQRAGNLPAAARVARDWVREEPGRLICLRSLARIYEQMNAYELAVDTWQRVLKINAKDGDAVDRINDLNIKVANR